MNIKNENMYLVLCCTQCAQNLKKHIELRIKVSLPAQSDHLMQRNYF